MTAKTPQPGAKVYQMDKALPCNLALEREVLGSLLKKPALLESLAVEADNFDQEKHRRIFRAIVDLANDNEPITYATVAGKLEDRNELESDGLSYLVGLTDNLPDILDLTGHTRILRDKAMRRLGIVAGQDLMNKCLLDNGSATKILTDHVGLVDFISQKGIGPDRGPLIRSIADLPSIRDKSFDSVRYLIEPELPEGAIVALTGAPHGRTLLADGKERTMTTFINGVGV